ncbi:MAG: undecaprenyl diphosphate synthase family protein [Clostridia bacterium]|jgi:undecaprenyl diphosphate synthase|nr:undecaprenyl diphosphate synthase family protein [Clostridia bacterium]
MNRNPKHIGIIPDGNRRWAVRNGFQKQDGYSYGLTPALRLLIAARERGIRELTYYGFTVDNCKRPKTQVTAFTDACLKAAEIIEREGASLYVVGNTESGCFPRGLLPYASRPKAENKMRINLLVNYGWEWDMKNGWASHEIPRIDLVIRWGGMSRLSGFLPIQTVYSDLYIVKDLWPDFQENQFEEALEWYHRQDVTLGG